MVFIAPLIGAAAFLAQIVAAVPTPVDLARSSDSSSGYGSSKGSYDSANGNYGSSSSSKSSKSSDSSSNGYSSSNSGYSSSNDGSSKSSSKDGYSSSNNGYGSSNNGYGSSNNGYGSSNNGYGSSKDSSKDSSSSDSKNSYSTNTYDNSYSSSTYENSYNSYTTTSTSEYSISTSTADSTSTAASSYTTAYGSGSSNWSSGYDDCVQQCVASFAPSASNALYTATSTSGSGGNGATVTVIVAPTAGTLRFVPFALNATVGTTVSFVWGASGHTVTSGSELLPCNATSDASSFDTGIQNQGFVFNQVVTSTDPTFFFCNAPGHCQKGMFGVINPESSFDAPTSVSGMMQSLAANNSDVKAYAALTNQATAGTDAALWAGNLDMAKIPDWAQASVVENVLFTRNVILNNPELLQSDGSLDLSHIGSTPLLLPVDVASALAGATATATTAVTAVTVAAAATSLAVTTTSNGAGALTSPGMVLSILAVMTTVFLL